MTEKILIIHTKKTSFVREDIDIISQIKTSDEYYFQLAKNPLKLFSEILKQTFFLFKNRTYTHYYIWFADYHAFIPILLSKIFKLKTYIVLGGYDTMSIPEISYGIFLKKNLRTLMVKYSIQNTNFLLGVDDSMFTSTNKYINKNGIPSGIDAFVKNIKGKKIVLPTGYDSEKWKKTKDLSKRNLIVTIGAINQEKGFLRKGFDLFSEIAKNTPEFNFIIVGPDTFFKEKIDRYKIPNLKVYSFMPQSKLIQFLQEAKVYCQLSIAEGLPNSLCEAMLCECIPVGSNVNGIPRAIENKLLILDEPNVKKAQVIIRRAMNIADKEGEYYRNLIINKYPKNKRIENLKKIL